VGKALIALYTIDYCSKALIALVSTDNYSVYQKPQATGVLLFYTGMIYQRCRKKEGIMLEEDILKQRQRIAAQGELLRLDNIEGLDKLAKEGDAEAGRYLAYLLRTAGVG
jgi:hypothetical protein